jgi:hypothetical protein
VLANGLRETKGLAKMESTKGHKMTGLEVKRGNHDICMLSQARASRIGWKAHCHSTAASVA